MEPDINTQNSLSFIARQRCRNHAHREAVARCPQCGYFFCRECVTEHEGRMLCNTCLVHTTRAHRRSPHYWSARLSLVMQGGLGFMLLWGVFYVIGQILLAIPHAFHEGTIWQTPWWQGP